MKLSNTNKRKKVIIIAAIVLAALLLVAGVVALIVTKTLKDTQIGDTTLGDLLNGGDGNANKDGLKGIMISEYPKSVYQVGDDFDPTGISIQVLATSNDKSYFIDETDAELKFSGFDSSVESEEVTITVTYKEFSTEYKVRVEKKPEPPTSNRVLTSIRLSDNFITTYSKTNWNFFGPTLDDVKLICTFSDGTEQSVPMLYNYIQNPNLNIQSACTYDLIIQYSYANTTVTTTVTITITN